MCIQLHSVKSLSRKTEDFVIISHSKLDLYHDGDLLYACVINSSHSTSTSGLPRNRKHSCRFCHSQLVKIRRLRQNRHNSCFLFRGNPFRPIAFPFCLIAHRRVLGCWVISLRLTSFLSRHSVSPRRSGTWMDRTTKRKTVLCHIITHLGYYGILSAWSF